MRGHQGYTQNAHRRYAWQTVLIGVLALLSSIVFVEAQPVRWSGNGHYYEVVLAPYISWEEARNAAAERVYRCRRGHLVTITSQAEQDFVWSLVRSCGSVSVQLFTGGYEATPGTGDWSWITGEPMHYTNWASGEPNNPGYETVIALGLFCTGRWNNVPPSGGWGSYGYIVEYEGEGAIEGDVDGSCCVDDADLLAVLFAFGQSGSDLSEDVNGDEVVDDADLLIVLFNFGSGC